MLRTPGIPIWKTAPFVRLLMPLITGILLQWYLRVMISTVFIAFLCFSVSLFLLLLLPLSVRFKIKSLQGMFMLMILVCFGMLITWQNDIRHDEYWYGKNYHANDCLLVRINEPLTERPRSLKAEGNVEAILHNGKLIHCRGKIVLYFSKDTALQTLNYGDRILIQKSLQAIKNSCNPGSFNYEQYAAFRQTFHQVYLNNKDWVILGQKNAQVLQQFIYSARSVILSVLRKNLPAEKDEMGIAEALLIGYTNDLDKDILQAYSNTGVVHIIAISGMHLALIYVMLVWLFSKIPGINKSKLVQLIFILGCLWLFSLLTGAAASVLRAAVMFSFISLGKYFSKQTTIYNSLASSAFVLLCYNPYYLWDVGFQLSYLAVISIVVYQQLVYRIYNCKNKWLDEIWKLVSISLAAQILTFPVCIYYFHQFPLLFLVANVIAVPVSSLILYAEIVLLIVSPIPYLNIFTGWVTSKLVWLMDWVIIWLNNLSFAVWKDIPSTIYSTIVLYVFVISIFLWLTYKNRQIIKLALISLLLFILHHTFYKWQIEQQHQLIVYNIPGHRAIDYTNGHTYHFFGDKDLSLGRPLQQTILKPARYALGLTDSIGLADVVNSGNRFYYLNKKRILLISESLVFEAPLHKIDLDIIIISGGPRIHIPDLAAVFNCSNYIFDASNSLWKIGKWKADCSALHLQYYSVPEKGAFITEL